MLLLMFYLEQPPEHIPHLVNVCRRTVKIQPIIKACCTDIKQGYHGRSDIVAAAIYRSVLACADKVLFILVEQLYAKIPVFITAHLDKIVFQYLPAHIHQRFGAFRCLVVVPERIVVVADGIPVDLATTCACALVPACIDVGMVFRILGDLKDSHAVIILDPVICNLTEEIRVVGQAEDLLGMIVLCVGFCIILILFHVKIVIAHGYHLAYKGSNNEKSAAVHRAYRVVNDNDPVYYLSVIRLASHDRVVEIEESDKVPLALAELVYDLFSAILVFPDKLIYIFCIGLVPKLKSLEACAFKEQVDLLHRSSSGDGDLVEISDLFLQIGGLLLKLFGIICLGIKFIPKRSTGEHERIYVLVYDTLIKGLVSIKFELDGFILFVYVSYPPKYHGVVEYRGLEGLVFLGKNAGHLLYGGYGIRIQFLESLLVFFFCVFFQ